MLTTTCDGIIYEDMTWDEIQEYLEWLDNQYDEPRPPVIHLYPWNQYDQEEDVPF